MGGLDGVPGSGAAVVGRNRRSLNRSSYASISIVRAYSLQSRFRPFQSTIASEQRHYLCSPTIFFQTLTGRRHRPMKSIFSEGGNVTPTLRASLAAKKKRGRQE